MDRVLDRLWIGTARDLDGATPLRTLGFVAAVDLRDGLRAVPHLGDVEVHRVQNRDGDAWSAEQVDLTFDFIYTQVRRGRVLVACAAGMSRSASVVIGYLVRCGWGPAEAHALVRRARPKIAPVPAMLEAALRVALGAPVAAGRTCAAEDCPRPPTHGNNGEAVCWEHAGDVPRVGA